MLRCFVLHHGKHEEQSWASLILFHEEGFKHPLDAMKALRTTLTRYVKDSAKPPKHCCAKMAEHANFCLTCGKQREPEETLDYEVAGTFVDLFGKVYDGTRRLWEAFDEDGWEHGKLGKPEETCTVVNVDRWLEDDTSYMEATFHDNTRWSTYDDKDF